jgi:hypothetical protein
MAKYTNLQQQLNGFTAQPQPLINTQPAGGWGALPQAQINTQPGGGSPFPLAGSDVSGPQQGWSALPQPLMSSLAGLLGGADVGGGPGGGGNGIMGLLGKIFGGGGNAGGAGAGGGMQSLIAALKSPMSRYQQIFTGGVPPSEPNPNDFPPEFPAADLSPGDFNTSPFGLASTGYPTGFGQTPSFGGPSMFGPTALPTFWNNYPGVGNVPFAVPNTPGGWLPSPGDDLSHGTPPLSYK